jgi:hypothetical protein
VISWETDPWNLLLSSSPCEFFSAQPPLDIVEPATFVPFWCQGCPFCGLLCRKGETLHISLHKRCNRVRSLSLASP